MYLSSFAFPISRPLDLSISVISVISGKLFSKKLLSSTTSSGHSGQLCFQQIIMSHPFTSIRDSKATNSTPIRVHSREFAANPAFVLTCPTYLQRKKQKAITFR